MQIYNNNNFTPQFTSRFNMVDYSTHRSLPALKRMLSESSGGEELFDAFISKISNDGKDDIFLLSQFCKHFELLNLSTNKLIKFQNRSLIDSVQDFVNRKKK